MSQIHLLWHLLTCYAIIAGVCLLILRKLYIEKHILLPSCEEKKTRKLYILYTWAGHLVVRYSLSDNINVLVP